MRRILPLETLTASILAIVPATMTVLLLTIWGMNSPIRTMPPVLPPAADFGTELEWWVVRPIAQFFAYGHMTALAGVTILLWLVITLVFTKLRSFYLAHPALHITVEWPTRRSA